MVQSEALVPSVSFNFSLSGLSGSDDPEKLRQKLIAARLALFFFSVFVRHFLSAFSCALVGIVLESLEHSKPKKEPTIRQWMFSNALV